MIGIVLGYYGAPRSLDEVVSYLEDIRGRSLTPTEAEKALKARREWLMPAALGAVTDRQAAILEENLTTRLGKQVLVRPAAKHPNNHPAVVRDLVDAGATQFVSFPLRAIPSHLGSTWHHLQVAQALKQHNLPVTTIDSWYADPGFIAVCAQRLRTALNWLPEATRGTAVVLFTTHSVPVVERGGGPSHSEMYQTWATQVAATAGVARFELSYRSAPPAPGWAGPDLSDVMRQQAAQGVKAVVICPLLTLSENLEVWQDTGPNCLALAQELGLELVRTELLNDAHDFMEVLTEIALERIMETCE